MMDGARETAERVARASYGRLIALLAARSRDIAGRTEHGALLALYDLLAQQAPTIGVLVGRAAAYGEAHGSAAGLALLDELPEERVRNYQPYWAARAHLLKTAGHEQANASFQRAIGLAADPAVRAYLAAQMV